MTMKFICHETCSCKNISFFAKYFANDDINRAYAWQAYILWPDTLVCRMLNLSYCFRIWTFLSHILPCLKSCLPSQDDHWFEDVSPWCSETIHNALVWQLHHCQVDPSMLDPRIYHVNPWRAEAGGFHLLFEALYNCLNNIFVT